MRRFVGQRIEVLAALFTPAAGRDLDDAVYPPICKLRRGPLRFRAVRDGMLMLEVTRCALESRADFRFESLFQSGQALFADVEDLAAFFNGPVAKAFGVASERAVSRSEPSDDADSDREDDLLALEMRVEPVVSVAAHDAQDIIEALSSRLEQIVIGQRPGIEWLAEAVASQFAKREPMHPGTVLLLGPPGSGKTTAIEALAPVLIDYGIEPRAHVHRINCPELTDDYDVHRLLGAAPGLVAYTSTPSLIQALTPGCILLLDDFDKAHPAVRGAFLSLLDSGAIMAPDGTMVKARGVVIALTSACGSDELVSRLHQVPSNDRSTVDRVARIHLLEEGWPGELVDRLETIVVFGSLEAIQSREAASAAINVLAAEYGLRLDAVPDVILDVVLDLAAMSGASSRGAYDAARRLLAAAFMRAAAEGFVGDVIVDAGPPPAVLRSPKL